MRWRSRRELKVQWKSQGDQRVSGRPKEDFKTDQNLLCESEGQHYLGFLLLTEFVKAELFVKRKKWIFNLNLPMSSIFILDMQD